MLTAHNIDQAWRDSIVYCVKHGLDYKIKGGSYVGQIRKQLPIYVCEITHPWTRPLAPIVPPGIPAPTTEQGIEDYFVRYIMSGEKAENEVYTYGSYIHLQLPRIIQLLNDSKGNTNQATIAVGDISTTFLDDPPCLRSICFKVYEGRLNLYCYFRSWDLVAGFPENLGGLQLLKEYLLDQLNFDIRDGKIFAMSSGVHIYEHFFDLVNLLNVEKI